MSKKVLVRKYVTNGDKVNRQVDTLEEGLKILGKTENEVTIKVDWLDFTDIFFKDTNNYLRVNNNL